MFVTAGKAEFSLRSKRTGDHLVYQVRRAKDNKQLWFVSAKTQDRLFEFVGTIFGSTAEDKPVFRYSPKASLGRNHKLVTAFAWYFERLIQQQGKVDGVEVWHVSRCGRCGRKLTDPSSIDSGFGPECAAMIRAFD
jgi:hypothetical protein